MFLEKLAERLLEAGVARALKARLQPVEIAKALSKEMDRSQVIAPGGRLVANQYQVHLHPDDLAEFAPFQASLEAQLAAFLTDYAARRALKPLSSPSVSLLPDPGRVALGAFSVRAALVDPEPEAIPSLATLVAPPEPTIAMPAVRRPSMPTAAPVRARLIGPNGRPFPLSTTVTTLGRAMDNDVVIESRDVSRHHARIAWEGDAYVLVDLGSTNGSFVSGQRVTRRPLSSGETISLGDARYVFQISDY